MPRPAQIRLNRTLDRSQIRGSEDARVVNDDTGVLVRVGPSLSHDDVILIAQRLPHVKIAVLEHCDRVSKHEVYGPVYVAVPVELPLRVDVQCVLVAHEAATVEDRVVRARTQGDRLRFLWPGRVYEGHALSDESMARNS